MFLPSKYKFAPNFFFPECDCCGGITGSPVSCGGCTLPSDLWQVTVSGVTDGTSSPCDIFNGTHELDITNDPWTGVCTIGCGSVLDLGGSNNEEVAICFTATFVSSMWKITRVTVSFGRNLSSGGSTWQFYDTDADAGYVDQDCGTETYSNIPENTTLGFPTGDCNNWPSTVTLEAA